MKNLSRIDIIGLNGPTGEHYMANIEIDGIVEEDCYKQPTEEYVDYQTRMGNTYEDKEYNIESTIFEQAQENTKAVEHPEHYNWMPIEAWDITKYMDHCSGSAVDYLIRHGRKDKTSAIEDCEKAIEWIKKRIETLRESKT